MNLKPQRMENESYEEYVQRRKENNLWQKQKQSKLLWDSRRGTYIKAKHGELNAETI